MYYFIDRCQCPLTDNTHFYMVVLFAGLIIGVCQCPLTGNTHFYLVHPSGWEASKNVSMPSHGQHSFLQSKSGRDMYASEMCQCPLTGNTHFYGTIYDNYMVFLECQCPLTGNTHFYSVKGVMPWVNINFVSMPSHGQHSFLLYPLIRPYFIRISDPIFAGNSQNILKKTLFRGFTRMFTVCSYLKILLKFSNLLSIRFDYTIIIRELHH